MKPSFKYKIIFGNRDQYPVVEMCTFFGVSRSGYYAYLKRKEDIDRDEPIARLIAECQESCGKNLLNRKFIATMSNSKWVADISYIQTSQGVLYLSIIRDLFDNSIVAYKTAKNQTVSLVLDTIHIAMGKEKVTGELLLHPVTKGFNIPRTVILP